MAVWAQKAEVALCIVVRIAVDMIYLDWHRARNRVGLIPSAHRACIAVLLEQITSHVSGYVSCLNASTPACMSIFPRNNVQMIAVVRLTLIRTIAIGSPGNETLTI